MHDCQPYIDLLCHLVATPSFSGKEDKTAGLIASFLAARNIPVQQVGNNVWAINRHFAAGKPTVLLNSHHDTVKPNAAYTRNPFEPVIEHNKLFGLGSNDAGGALVALLAAFIHFYDQPLHFNLVYSATAEEEISGKGGIESLWPYLPPIDMAIVGEPTLCQMAVAEKGLLVLDCTAHGTAGHAAHHRSDNAIYTAVKDIEWFSNYRFEKISPWLGEVKMTVTAIHAGDAHNMVPPECLYTVDVRVTDAYTLEEVLHEIKRHVNSVVVPRSVRLRPSGIDPGHPLVRAATDLGIEQYGSPTTSDQALIPVPSVKIGPGDSQRSHTADEYIELDEFSEGINTYIRLLGRLNELLKNP
ncbi:MAG: acetylornithine deacetylase [Cyclobacteriaceae bacterium]|nr:MAG: acetylornithine deacetylase [Cyclobacteriaceae bacterium]